MINSPGKLFFNTTFWEGTIQEGSYFFNVVFSILTERNSFQRVAKLSFFGQRTIPIVYAMTSPGSYSMEELFLYRYWERQVNREGSLWVKGELFKEIQLKKEQKTRKHKCDWSLCRKSLQFEGLDQNSRDKSSETSGSSSTSSSVLALPNATLTRVSARRSPKNAFCGRKTRTVSSCSYQGLLVNSEKCLKSTASYLGSLTMFKCSHDDHVHTVFEEVMRKICENMSIPNGQLVRWQCMSRSN